MLQLVGHITQLTLKGIERYPTGTARRSRVVNAVAAFDHGGREVTVTFVWPREKDVPSIGQAMTLTITPGID